MRASLLLFFASLILLTGCNRKTEDLSGNDKPSDYFVLQPGKFVTYRLDSTVFPNFGTTTAVRSYQEKHVVDAQIPDALGRPSYRIFRYTRDTAATQAWKPSGTYFVTPLQNSVEVIEDNLRSVRLIGAITENNTWKGNRYYPDDPYPSYDFNNDNGNDMTFWDNTYSGVGGSEVVNSKTYTNVVTVDGIDERLNVPVTMPQSYGTISYFQEKYARGVGMIFQEFIMWDYQPPNGSIPNGRKSGFGVKRTILDHN